MDARQHYQQLVARLRQAEHAYYVLARPVLSDAAYDRLFRELQDLEAEHPDWVDSGSPTQRVGAPLPEGTRFTRVPHVVPMVSIESLFAEDEVRDFDARVRKGLGKRAPRYVGEPKWDGVSAALIYRDGDLVQGLSRGDGAEGEDLTHNLRAVAGVPLRLLGEQSPRLLEVRGEVLMPVARFAATNQTLLEEGTAPFANPRNATAGTLKRLDPSFVAQRGLRFLAFEVVRHEPVDGVPALAGHVAALDALQAWGFPVSPERVVSEDLGDLLRFHRELEERRDSIAFEMDGVVYKVDAYADRQALGARARTPRWACAYKFAPREETTRLLDIEIQVGRTGRLTPRAVLEPVQLGGVTVQHATLHNARYLRDLDLRLGDLVHVRRAGDVIPQVLGPVPEARTGAERAFVWPDACPSCAGHVVTRGEYRYCVNLDCPAQRERRILHLASRTALRIEGLGEKAVAQFAAAGLLDGVERVFALDYQAIAALDGWGEKSAQALRTEVDAARQPALDRFLVALGIEQIGGEVARALAASFGSWGALECCCRMAALHLTALEDADEARRSAAGRLQRFVVRWTESQGEGAELTAHFQRYRAGALAEDCARLAADPNEESAESGSAITRTVWPQAASLVETLEAQLAGAWPETAKAAPPAVLRSVWASAHLQGVELLGEIGARSLAEFFAEPRNREALRRMQEFGVAPQAAEAPGTATDGGQLAGLRFVLTGSLSRPRPEIAAQIAAAGGKVISAVSAKTDYLIAGEKAGSKLVKAEKLGVQVLDEAGLDRLLAGEPA